MPARDKSRLGEPAWIDLVTDDTDSARTFYTALFGWTATESIEEHGNFITFWHDDEQVAGLNRTVSRSGTPAGWLTYLSVADADDTTKRAQAAGAEVRVQPRTVGSQGRMAVLTDPAGAVFALWQSAEHTGYGRFGEYGTPVWHELSTRDFDKATRFYRDVFDWRLAPLSDTDEFRYSVFGPEGHEVGGVFDAAATLPADAPSSWSVYIGVENVTTCTARAAELGGRVIREPWQSQYGTFAQVSDPAGGTLLLSSVEDVVEITEEPGMAGHA